MDLNHSTIVVEDLDLVTVFGVQDNVPTSVRMWENIGGRFVPDMLSVTSTEHPIYLALLDFCGDAVNASCRLDLALLGGDGDGG